VIGRGYSSCSDQTGEWNWKKKNSFLFLQKFVKFLRKKVQQRISFSLSRELKCLLHAADAIPIVLDCISAGQISRILTRPRKMRLAVLSIFLVRHNNSILIGLS
jgi:hypothetical protein